MYEELVEALRLCVKYENAMDALMNASQAADAIVRLRNISLDLLAKYEEEATSVIWETSGRIYESLDYLHEEIASYRAKINGVEEPQKKDGDGNV